MIVVRWSPGATQDLIEILDYYDDYGSSFGTVLEREFDTVVLQLPDSPYFGREVPGYRVPLLREALIRGYLLTYRLNAARPTEIEILSVDYSGAR